MARGERLLVTGASGFLGAHVVRAAARAGWRVVAVRHQAPLAEPLPPGASEALADLSVEHDVARLLASVEPAAIVQAAALSRLADCEADPERALAVNVEAARALARWSAARGARLVHVSTDLVFGLCAAPPGGFTEDDEPGPLSEYGRSKLAAERAVSSTDPHAVIARLPLLVGPSHGRGLGASDSVLAAHALGEIPRLFEDEWRTPLDVRSAAEALVELASREIAGRLHVAGPERLSRHELGLRALRQAGLRADRARAAVAPSQRGTLGALRPADVALDASRARALLRTVLVGLDGGAT